jgi:hypothetical protein
MKPAQSEGEEISSWSFSEMKDRVPGGPRLFNCKSVGTPRGQGKRKCPNFFCKPGLQEKCQDFVLLDVVNPSVVELLPVGTRRLSRQWNQLSTFCVLKNGKQLRPHVSRQGEQVRDVQCWVQLDAAPVL